MERRTAGAIGAGAVLVVIGAFWGVTHRAHAAAPAAPAGPHVPLVAARFGSFDVRVTAQGRIGPPAGSSAKVAFAQAGVLGALDVRVGETVTAGQPVAELRRDSFAIAVEQADADAASAAHSYGGGAVPSAALRSAQAKLVTAQDKLRTLEAGGQAAQSTRIAAVSAARQAAVKVEGDRTTLAREEQLFAGGVAAARDVQAARAQLASDEADQRAADARVQAAGADFTASLAQAHADAAQAASDVRAAQAQTGVLGDQLASAQARAATARLALANTVLRAPASGVVLAVLKRPGEAVDTTTPVLEIGPPPDGAVTLQVPGDAARSVHVGDPTQLQIAQSGARTQAAVTAVVPAVDPATQVATVVVGGALPGGSVAGDAVTAVLTVGHKRGIIVPETALVQDAQTGKNVVFVRKDDGTFAMREVSVVASDGTSAVVNGGLKAGEQLASRGGYELLAPAGGG